MKNVKIFITGPRSEAKYNLAKKLVEIDDNLSICPRFINDTEFKGLEDKSNAYYLSTQDIDLTYKNNFILFVDTNNYVSTGVSMDNFYNNEIFVLSMREFNNISDTIFNSESNDIILIWLDSDYNKNKENMFIDTREAKFLEERLNAGNIKYMYFYNESLDTISDIIFEYISASEEERNEILLKNS